MRVHRSPGWRAPFARVLLVCLGPRGQFGDEAFRKAIAGPSRALGGCAAVARGPA